MSDPVGRISGTGTAACLLALLLARAAAAAPAVQLPPLGDAHHPEHHPGKMIWADLVTPDLAAAERFYGELFGWRFAPSVGVADYDLASIDGRAIAGIAQRAVPAGEHRQPAWLPFFAVHDVDASVKAAWRAGGALLVAPRTYPARGRQAALRDPEGAAFGLLASPSGDPPDVLADPGEWIWSSLLAHDPAHDAGFYQKLLDYEVFDLPKSTGEKDAGASGDGGAQHMILSSEDYARTSINGMPADAARRHPHWILFVRVAAAEAAAAKAVALGGKILVPSRVDRHGGKVSVVADPSGAPIGLMEWTEDGHAGDAK